MTPVGAEFVGYSQPQQSWPSMHAGVHLYISIKADVFTGPGLYAYVIQQQILLQANAATHHPDACLTSIFVDVLKYLSLKPCASQQNRQFGSSKLTLVKNHTGSLAAWSAVSSGNRALATCVQCVCCTECMLHLQEKEM